MRNAFFIIFFGILIYLGVSTAIADGSVIGRFGAAFALFNHKYFGYLSYVYPFLLLYPLYVQFRYPSFTARRLEVALASVLLFFSFIILQGILATGELRGKFGADFVEFLSPFIGLFGVWVFWFISTSVGVTIFFEKSFHEFISPLLNRVENFKSALQERKEKKENQKQAEKYIVDQEEDTYAQIEEEDIDELDKPAYLRASADIEDAPFEIKLIKKENETNGGEEDEDEDEIEIKKADDLKGDETTIVSIAKKVKEQKNNTVIVDELEENAKLLESIEKGRVEKPKNFKLPSVNFLQKPPAKANTVDEAELDDKIKDLIEKLAHFNIEGDVIRTYAGPVVSTFEFKPAANVKVSKILNLQDDLAMALRAQTIRIQAPIPGKDVVGIEIPNHTVETIYLRELIESDLFQNAKSPLSIVLGKDIVGKPFITDLKKLPHLLIAGTTGSGKSVGINAMILSLLYKNSPDHLRLLMVDPKMLEFSIYNDIPHLLTPVITKAKQAVVALNNMVVEMERRYEMMSDTRTKNIENYNEKMKKEGGKELPYIVVIIDELADLMMTSGKDVEQSIARLAQMARAAGIHLVVATQRPSVDVVTGLIKANLPSRISYRVGQKVDSKIILDQQGAESLLGRGDMLFTPPGATGLVRLHAPWSTEEEIENIVEFIKSQREPDYDKSFLLEDNDANKSASDEVYEELDPLYEEARNIILAERKTSISYLQRRLQIGYNRSARVIEQLEQNGILSEPNSKGIREIL
ncbi:DNA translocase FtsK 4TM domain-containing protein [Sulfurimonas sp. HSL-1716]|uniref:FtsK/SpoIIIE family DNA translocase n=1 Tax=Hydrocurvibacter sulfurireducens TaxID=3131937 RepID=UPI0031F9346F